MVTHCILTDGGCGGAPLQAIDFVQTVESRRRDVVYVYGYWAWEMVPQSLYHLPPSGRYRKCHRTTSTLTGAPIAPNPTNPMVFGNIDMSNVVDVA